MRAVFLKELRVYFSTMIGYVFIAAFLLSTGLLFAINNIFLASDSFANVLLSTCYIMILIIPALTMRSFAEERKNKTDQLLLCAPIKVISIVLGKFFAALTVLALALLVSLVFPLILCILGSPHPGEIVLGYMGCLLIGACLIATGVFISSVTENQLSCALSTTVVLLILFLADNVGPTIPIPAVSNIVSAISPFYYLKMFRIGLLLPVPVAFLLIFSTALVLFTVVSIDARMWRKQ